MSTTEIGDRFRDEVTELLRVRGFSPISEILSGHKRVDILFEETTFGKARRYAVEAKNWSAPLSKTDLEAIYGGYASLLLNNKIDELLVVSRHRLTSPAAKNFIQDTPHFSHLTFNEFQESILGFHQYLSAYVYAHQSDGLEEYYIPPVLDDGRSLEDHIESWLSSDSKHPIAIIAGYGMGKTSFARHLAFQLAQRFLAGEPGRVPILVALGTISREQSLEGLVGTVLAGSNPAVVNYNFPTFSHLNELGRFVIFLDGFDEMKHMMSQSEFYATFDELNKLARGRAKVILSGRPTAFLSDSERETVLRGAQKVGRATVSKPGAPKYTELKLSLFSPDQLRKFIRSYMERHRRVGNIEVSDSLLQKRQIEIEDKAHEELISRPIHARMLADLATDPGFSIGGLSRFGLYDHFVNHLIAQEIRKPGRGRLYRATDRRLFLADLAWYLWTSESSKLGCRLDDLPDDLFLAYKPDGEDLISVKRDLLSGSFLDEKAGGVFFFSHRSFQEFLVAEHIWNRMVDEPNLTATVADHMVQMISPEVFDFLRDRDDRDFFKSLLSLISEKKLLVPLEMFVRVRQRP